MIEYNAHLPRDAELVQPLEPEMSWDGTDYFGASLLALSRLAAKGYRLVHTDLAGVNAFFVREDLAAPFLPEDRVPVRAPNFFLTGAGTRPTRAAAATSTPACEAPPPRGPGHRRRRARDARAAARRGRTRDGRAWIEVEVRATPALRALAEAWAGAEIRVGSHWLGAKGSMLAFDGARTDAFALDGCEMAPVRRLLSLDDRRPEGGERLQVDLVAEGVAWGHQAGLGMLELSPPAGPPLPAGRALAAGPPAPAEPAARTREWLAAAWPRGASEGEMADYVGRRPRPLPDERRPGARAGPHARDRRQPVLHHPAAHGPRPGRAAHA